MANGPSDFKDPKVTKHTTASTGGGVGKWVGILAGIIILLLLLGWVLGWFSNDDTDTATVPAENPTLTDGTAPAAEGDASGEPAPATNN